MSTKYGIALHVWGEYACFTRPELKSERMSYEVMTPSAARGILSAVYWKPQFRWVVDRIRVLAPIRFAQVRRNELSNKIAAPASAVMKGKKADFLGMFIEENRQQRSATILRDVDYVIEAHVEVPGGEADVNAVAKHLGVFKRRASKGQCFHQPCMGTREFPAMFELADGAHPAPPCRLPAEQLNRCLGLMLHDMVYKADPEGKIICAHTGQRQSAEAHFFMAELRGGVLSVPPLGQTLS